METQIKMAAKLYQCRDSAKSLCKMQNKDYLETLKPFTQVIEQVMAAKKIQHIPALLEISRTPTYQNSGVVQMFYMAAMVELMEPSVKVVKSRSLNPKK